MSITLSVVSSCSSVGLRPIKFIRIDVRERKAIITICNSSVHIYHMYRPIMYIIVGPPGGIVVSATYTIKIQGFALNVTTTSL
jgi:hypothetical protein